MSIRQSYGIFYTILVTIMISSIDFTEFSYTVQQFLWNWWVTDPVSLAKQSRVLAMRAQPDLDFAAPWRLAFNIVLRADFTAWALPSANLVEY